MSEFLLVSLAATIVLGITAQWLAWRVRLPSILVLLLFGFLVGPVFHLLDPDALMGDWLMPLVSVSVGLILFEGGLTLRFKELKTIGHVLRNLITLGAGVTWLLSAVAARFLFGWDWKLATLLGAILIVTGPTVVLPLLRHVQPTRQVGSTLKWEGILIDPIGALFALLVFEAIAAHDMSSVPMMALQAFGKTLLIGVVLGVSSAVLLVISFKRFWVPDHLQNPVSLMVVIAVFAISNHFQHESGLLTVTIMGIALANQKSLHIRHIVEFKENLRVLLISWLFILLSARVHIDDFKTLGLPLALVFLGVLIFVVRPVAVWLSTAGSALSRNERIFLGWMAPRGIVAAAVASIFALRLAQEGHERAGELVPAVFIVIVGTVTIYGLTAAPVARWLGVSKPNPQGVLFVGAHAVVRAIAKVLHNEGYSVVLADTNWENLSAARLDGLSTYYGNVLSESARDELEMPGIGKMLAMTPNHEVNTLSAMHFVEFFGRSGVYQIAVGRELSKKIQMQPHGRLLFGKQIYFRDLATMVAEGYVVRKTTLTPEYTFEQWKMRQSGKAIPLFLMTATGVLKIFTAGESLKPSAGQTLIALVKQGGNSGTLGRNSKRNGGEKKG